MSDQYLAVVIQEALVIQNSKALIRIGDCAVIDPVI